MEHPLKLGIYYRYTMPTQAVLDYYNQKLIGKDGLHGFLPAIKISDEIDAFVSLGPKEICNHTLYSQGYDIVNKIRGNVSFQIKDDGYVRLRTKFVCASVYQILCQIEKCQDDIEEHRPNLANRIGGMSSFERELSYKQVPIEYYQKMRSAIDSSHMKFEKFKAMSINDEFRESVFKRVTGEVSNYWTMFGLDYTPVSQKVEDKVIGCGAQALLYAIGILIFWLIAYAATH